MMIKRNEKKIEYLQFEEILFLVKFRRVKYPRIEFKCSGPVIISPLRAKPMDLLQGNRQTILKKYRQMKKKVKRSETLVLVERSETDFCSLVDTYVKQYCQQLSVITKKVIYRKMKRRWGSCRSDGVITLNRCLLYLPEDLIAYVIYHEVAHLLIKGHQKDFKALIARKFKFHRQLDERLNLYGIRLLAQS